MTGSQPRNQVRATSLSAILRSELDEVSDDVLKRRLANRAAKRMYRLQVAGVGEQVALNIIHEELKEAKDYHYELIRESQPSLTQETPSKETSHRDKEGRTSANNNRLEQSQHDVAGVNTKDARSPSAQREILQHRHSPESRRGKTAMSHASDDHDGTTQDVTRATDTGLVNSQNNQRPVHIHGALYRDVTFVASVMMMGLSP